MTYLQPSHLNTPTASLQRGKALLNECPDNDTKLSDSEAPVLELWGIWITPSLPLFLDSL